MKKFICLLLTLCLCVNLPISAKNSVNEVPSVARLLEQYKGHNGFEVIKMGSFALSLFRAAARAEADEEDMMALAFLNGIKKMYVAEYSGASASARRSFQKELERVLNSWMLLLEEKDEENNVLIYCGSSSTDGYIRDVVIYIPSDCAVVCLEGKLSAQAVSEMYTN